VIIGNRRAGELRDEGKIRFVGVSEVSVDELRRARELVSVATVQNRFNLAEHDADPVLQACETDGLGFMPWAPIRMRHPVVASAVLAAIATRHRASPAQIALAWLLRRSPVVLPIRAPARWSICTRTSPPRPSS
jgi:aryl-alcohol dehydrogenase-like predicted oxidoreductase